ncbi:NADH dehydrogenase [ubiquinone] 1 alpha subcomplex subunit 9, mitochondrial [Galdieria sulphuraria]|nr:NADH dehydrogenase [ubiquinone] 1 alpha subcomplex subunit 9, mitochondrial [Galdieria sulphuraria]
MFYVEECDTCVLNNSSSCCLMNISCFDFQLFLAIYYATGFIGREFLRCLDREKRDFSVVRILSRKNKDISFLEDLNLNIEYIQGSITSQKDVETAIKGASHVVNLVGILYPTRNSSFDSIHHESVKNIARICNSGSVQQFVHISALGSSLDSSSEYARTKALGEKAALSLFPQSTVLKPSIVYGPEDDFFNRFYRMAKISPVLPLVGGGQTQFQPVHVSDVAQAILVCLDEKQSVVGGKVYELGGPHVKTFRQLLRLMLRYSDPPLKRLLVPMPFWLAKTQSIVFELAHQLFGVAPMLTMDQVELLKTDNIVTAGSLNLLDLGITPKKLSKDTLSYLKS